MFFATVAIIAILVVVIVFSAVRILREYERGVVFTLGRYTGTKGPGFFLLVPLVLAQFVATYACPFPDAVSPTFDTNFARLEHTATGRFNLAFMRHTGKWHELFSGQTLEECLTAIRDDAWFHP